MMTRKELLVVDKEADQHVAYENVRKSHLEALNGKIGEAK